MGAPGVGPHLTSGPRCGGRTSHSRAPRFGRLIVTLVAGTKAKSSSRGNAALVIAAIWSVTEKLNIICVVSSARSISVSLSLQRDVCRKMQVDRQTQIKIEAAEAEAEAKVFYWHILASPVFRRLHMCTRVFVYRIATSPTFS